MIIYLSIQHIIIYLHNSAQDKRKRNTGENAGWGFEGKEGKNEAVIRVEGEGTNVDTLIFSSFFLAIILVANIVTIVKTQNI